MWPNQAPEMVYLSTDGKTRDHIIVMSGKKAFLLTVHLQENVLPYEENKTMTGQ